MEMRQSKKQRKVSSRLYIIAERNDAFLFFSGRGIAGREIVAVMRGFFGAQAGIGGEKGG